MELTANAMLAAVRVIQAKKWEDTRTRILARQVYAGYLSDYEMSAAERAEKMRCWDTDRDLGEALLHEYMWSQSEHRTTIFPRDLSANQIAVDAGYIAMSPAWTIYTFKAKI